MRHLDSTSPRGFPVPPVSTQSDKTGRRSYKMMKSIETENLKVKKEPVWPPICEEALLEGLRLYKPVSKSGRPLRRFVKRNVFIALHILRKTGKKRTPKQVGSRLQQISESSKDEESQEFMTVKMLITNRDFPADQIFTEVDSNLSSGPSTPSVLTPTGDYMDTGVADLDLPRGLAASPSIESLEAAADFTLGYPPSPVSPLDIAAMGAEYEYPPPESMSLFVELLSPDSPAGYTAQLGLDADITPHSINIILSLDAQPTMSGGLQAPFNASVNARKLSDIPSPSLFCQTPQLTIVSPLLSVHKTYFGTFGVYLDATKPVHSEIASLSVEAAPVDCPPGSFVWRTPVLAEFWGSLAGSSCIDRYTIVLDISELPSSSSDCVNLKSAFSVAFSIKSTSVPPSLSLSPSLVDEEFPLAFPDTSALASSSSSSSSLDSMSLYTPLSHCSRMYSWLESTGSYQSLYAYGAGEQLLDRQYPELLEGYAFPTY